LIPSDLLVFVVYCCPAQSVFHSQYQVGKEGTMSKRTLFGISTLILMVVIGIGIWSVPKFLRKPVEPLKKVTLASGSSSFTGYSVFVAFEKGYFQDQGLDVTLQTYPHGKATLNAVIAGEANLGTSSETPFMHAVLNGGKLYALATMLTAEKHLAIVARKDRGIVTADDLKGKTIGVTLGTNGEYFLDTVLLLHEISREEIQAVHLKPGQMFDTLMNGGVDAIATWNPQMYQAQKELGDQGSTFYAEGLYAASFVIAARQEYVHTNPEIIEKVIRSLVHASRFIREHPDESREIVAHYLKMDESLLKELSAIYHFKIALDQSFLLTLENQTEWAIKHHLTEQTQVPNYLDFVYPDALETVKPESVTIIR